MRLYLLLSLPRRRIFCRNSTVSDRFNWWKRKEGKFYSQLELDSRKKAGSSFSGTFRRTKFGKGIWGGGRDGSWRIQDSRIKGILSPRYSVFGNRWSPRNFLLGIPGTTAAIRPGSRGQHGLPRDMQTIPFGSVSSFRDFQPSWSCWDQPTLNYCLVRGKG